MAWRNRRGMALSKKGSLMAEASSSNSSCEMSAVISSAGRDGFSPDIVIARISRNNCVAQLD